MKNLQPSGSRLIQILLLSLVLSLPLLSTCSAQTLQVEESQQTRLEQIFNQLALNNEQQDKQLQKVNQLLVDSNNQIIISNQQITKLNQQLTIANNSINQAQNSLEKVNKSFATYEKQTNSEIKKLKLENLGLMGIIVYLVIK